MIERYDPKLERTKDTVTTYMCLGRYLYVLKNPFQNALYMYFEHKFSACKSLLYTHVEE